MYFSVCFHNTSVHISTHETGSVTVCRSTRVPAIQLWSTRARTRHESMKYTILSRLNYFFLHFPIIFTWNKSLVIWSEKQLIFLLLAFFLSRRNFAKTKKKKAKPHGSSKYLLFTYRSFIAIRMLHKTWKCFS